MLMMIIYTPSSEESLFHKHLKVPCSYLKNKRCTSQQHQTLLLFYTEAARRSQCCCVISLELVSRHGEARGSRVKSKWSFWSFWAAACSVFHVAPSEPNKRARFLLLVENVITGRLDWSLQQTVV